jgi:hypothetical protein
LRVEHAQNALDEEAWLDLADDCTKGLAAAFTLENAPSRRR